MGVLDFSLDHVPMRNLVLNTTTSQLAWTTTPRKVFHEIYGHLFNTENNLSTEMSISRDVGVLTCLVVEHV